MAKRLLSHALGLPGMRDRAGERVLSDARRVAREDRKQRRELQASTWDG